MSLIALEHEMLLLSGMLKELAARALAWLAASDYRESPWLAHDVCLGSGILLTPVQIYEDGSSMLESQSKLSQLKVAI